MNWLIQLVGTVLVLLALADIFLTVLYPRSNKGVVSVPLSKGLWQLFRFAAKIPYCDRDLVLSYCGPTLLVVIVTVWVSLLSVGFALIVWPALGSEIQSSQGSTPTDFISALYYSGYAFTTLGVGSIVPKTGIYKLLIILEAALGFATFTLTLTYFLSVYSALTRRNTFALSLYHRSARSADVGVIITRMVAEGDFNGARQEIADIAKDLLNLLESHHSYPVLHYFRFQEAYYSLAQISLVTMDTVSLIKSVLSERNIAP